MTTTPSPEALALAREHSDLFTIEREEDGHRYYVVAFAGETHYDTEDEAIAAAREYGGDAERDQLRATVIELRRQLDSLACVGADYARLEAELATERQRAEVAEAQRDASVMGRALKAAKRRLEASEAKRKALREALADARSHLASHHPHAVERLDAALAADGKDTP